MFSFTFKLDIQCISNKNKKQTEVCKKQKANTSYSVAVVALLKLHAGNKSTQNYLIFGLIGLAKKDRRK